MGDSRPPNREIDTVFMLICSFTILWISSLFYSGLTHRRSALIQASYGLICATLVSIQWAICGHSLVFTEGGWFIGSFRDIFYKLTIRSEDSEYALSSAVATGMFPIVTAGLMIGAVAYRGRVLPACIFVLVWTTIVYDPIAYWTWNQLGWSNRLGTLDYAGGTPVHITAGLTALAYSVALGRRNTHESHSSRPHNMILVVVGTAMMWVGWLGFNACAAKTVSRQAAMAVVNTQISAAFGGISWVLMDYHLDSEWSIVGLCSGVVAGLVTVTPGAGYVHPWAASLFGIFGGICCNFGTQLKFYLATDDALDVLAIHGVGGFVGTLLTGIFASRGLEPNARGGFVDGNYMQLIDQLIAVAAGAIYSFVVSYLILILLNRTKGLQLRVPPEHELVGLDIVEHDEFAYDVSDFFATEGPEVPPEVQSYSDDPDRGDSDRGGPFLNSSMFPGRL